MSVTAIDVRTVQQGLTQASAETPIVPPPGAIDGLWGPQTRASLDIFLGDRGFEPHGSIASVPARSTMISLEADAVDRLRQYAATYVASRPRAPRASTLPTLPTSAILAPSAFPSWVLPTVLGLGAALVVVGGGYWLYTRRSRRGRRR